MEAKEEKKEVPIESRVNFLRVNFSRQARDIAELAYKVERLLVEQNLVYDRDSRYVITSYEMSSRYEKIKTNVKWLLRCNIFLVSTVAILLGIIFYMLIAM